jgi:hypothetical protein
VDQDVGTGFEGAASLTFTLGMEANRQPMLVCGAYHGNECRVIEKRPTAVQHQFDDIVPMLSRFLDRANTVFRSCQFSHRSWRRPRPVGRVAANGGQERPSDLDDAASR